MRPIEPSEILDIAAYEAEREWLRPAMMALKDRHYHAERPLTEAELSEVSGDFQ